MSNDSVPRVAKLDVHDYLQWSTELEHIMRFKGCLQAVDPAGQAALAPMKREVSGWMRCFTQDRSEARGQQPPTPLVCPSLNVLEAHPLQRSDRAHKSRRPSRSPRESPRAQLQNELPSRYMYK